MMSSTAGAELALTPTPWPPLRRPPNRETPRFKPWEARPRTLTRAAHDQLTEEFTLIGRSAGLVWAPLPVDAALMSSAGDDALLHVHALAAAAAGAPPAPPLVGPTAAGKMLASAAAAKPAGGATTPAAIKSATTAVGAPAPPPPQPAGDVRRVVGLGVEAASLVLAGGDDEAGAPPALVAFLEALRLAAAATEAVVASAAHSALLPVMAEEVAVVDDGTAASSTSSGFGIGRAFNVRLHWAGRWVAVTVPRALPVLAAEASHQPAATTDPAPGPQPAYPVQWLRPCDGGFAAASPPSEVAYYWPAVAWLAWLALSRSSGTQPGDADPATAALSALTGWLPLPLEPGAPSAAALAAALAHTPTDAPTPAEAAREWCFAAEDAATGWARGVEGAVRAERARVRAATQAAAEAGVDVSALPALLSDATRAWAEGAAATATAASSKAPSTAAARRGSVPTVAAQATPGPATSAANPTTAQLIADCAPRPMPLPPRPLLVPPLVQLRCSQAGVGGEPAPPSSRPAAVTVTLRAARDVPVDAAGRAPPLVVSRSGAVSVEAFHAAPQPIPSVRFVAGAAYTVVAVRTAPLEARYVAVAGAPASGVTSGTGGSASPPFIRGGTLSHRLCGDRCLPEPLVLLRGPFAAGGDSGAVIPTPSAARRLAEAGLREIAVALASGGAAASAPPSSVATATEPLRAALDGLSNNAAFPSHPGWADPAAVDDVWLPLSALTAPTAADGGCSAFDPTSLRLLLRPAPGAEPVVTCVQPPAAPGASSAPSVRLWPTALWVSGSSGGAAPSAGVLIKAHVSARPPPSSGSPQQHTLLPSQSLVVERDARFDALLPPAQSPPGGSVFFTSGGGGLPAVCAAGNRLVLPLADVTGTAAAAVLALPAPTRGSANTAGGGARYRLSLEGAVSPDWEVSVSAVPLPPATAALASDAGVGGGEAHFSLAASGAELGALAPAAHEPLLPSPLCPGPLPEVLSRGARLAVRTAEAVVTLPPAGAPAATALSHPTEQMTSCSADGGSSGDAVVVVCSADSATFTPCCSLSAGGEVCPSGTPLLLHAGDASPPQWLHVSVAAPAVSSGPGGDVGAIGVLAASRPPVGSEAGSWHRTEMSGPQLPAVYRAAGTAALRLPGAAVSGTVPPSLSTGTAYGVVSTHVLQWLITPSALGDADTVGAAATGSASATATTARRDSTTATAATKPAAGKGGKAVGAPAASQPHPSPPRFASLLVGRWAVSVDVSALRGAAAAAAGAAAARSARLTR